ncbi:MAG: hypothetical protein ACJAW8_002706 [Oleispira sp.]|jgi:hypothetical protein
MRSTQALTFFLFIISSWFLSACSMNKTTVQRIGINAWLGFEYLIWADDVKFFTDEATT